MNASPQPVREWFYERDGVAEGPFDVATLRSMIGTQLSPQAMVWREGQPEWLPASQVETFKIPGMPVVVAPAPALRLPPPPPPAPITTVAPRAAILEPVGTGELVLLSIVTLGIYGLVKFYEAGVSLTTLTGRPSRFVNLFWWYVGLSIAGVVLSPAGIGAFLMIAAVVLGAMALAEAINLRDELLRRHGGSTAAMLAKNTHVAVWTSGAVLSVAFIGVFALLWQGVRFFEEYAATLQAVRRNAR